ncbi:NAD(P)-dependent oxidoreductase [uncultured Planktosalinus sp.]|uniref:NAD(P)-dependent oxidoreductase n=1 Tax=uncultured Planktosalinus sp. TaxID=1810935 RepID=UPI0030DB809F
MEILITEPTDFSQRALNSLSKIGFVKKGPFSKEELINEVGNTNILIVRLGHLINQPIFDNAKNLKYILTPTTGLNHIDVDNANKRGIHIISLKGEHEFLDSIPSTAEHTWALLMSLIRKIPQACDDVKMGNWDRDKFKGNNLNTLSLGVFGFGRVGKQVAKIAKCFNMKIYVYDKKKIETKLYNVVNSKSELFQKSDIVSIHLDLNKGNINIVDKELLRFLKKGAFLINTSRGELINEDDLVTFLENKTLAGVALDVIHNENATTSKFNNPIISYAKNNNNAIITPHIAGATLQSMKMTEEFVVDKFINILNQRTHI